MVNLSVMYGLQTAVMATAVHTVHMIVHDDQQHCMSVTT